MPDSRTHAWLLGQSFETRFTVLKIGSDRDRTVTLQMRGATYEMSLAELLTVIERGFVVPVLTTDATS